MPSEEWCLQGSTSRKLFDHGSGTIEYPLAQPNETSHKTPWVGSFRKLSVRPVFEPCVSLQELLAHTKKYILHESKTHAQTWKRIILDLLQDKRTSFEQTFVIAFFWSVYTHCILESECTLVLIGIFRAKKCSKIFCVRFNRFVLLWNTLTDEVFAAWVTTALPQSTLGVVLLLVFFRRCIRSLQKFFKLTLPSIEALHLRKN